MSTTLFVEQFMNEKRKNTGLFTRKSLFCRRSLLYKTLKMLQTDLEYFFTWSDSLTFGCS